MFQGKDVRMILENYIERGFSKFIIYPFGDNGVLVKNLLKDYFNIEPAYIVDNKYSKYHTDIISSDELAAISDPSYLLILTIEDWNLNLQMEEECLKYFDNSCVINLKKRISGTPEIVISKFLPKEYCREAFDMRQFIDFTTEKNEKESKIKVRILHQGARIWNVYETVCSAFKNDLQFDVLLILTPAADINERKQQAIEQGYEYIEWCEYKPSIDLPDIFIHSSPLMAQTVKSVCACAKISFIIPLTLMVYSSDHRNGSRNTMLEIEKSGVDYCLAESLLYNDLPKDSDVKVLEFGNPKFDVLYRLSLKRKASSKFEKLDHKRVILYSTTHGIREGCCMEGITFDLYARKIFEFVDRNPEIGLIFRPHPQFITELIENHYWTEQYVAKVRQYMDSSENMVWDDNDTYEEALVVTDAIITDGYCGIILSTMPLMKPICALYRSHDTASMCPKVDEYLYIAREEKELNDFLTQVVRDGKDGMVEAREECCNKFIKHFDGKNGQRIKDFIAKTYFDL